MDKLEKALSKAREQRQAALAEAAAQVKTNAAAPPNAPEVGSQTEMRESASRLRTKQVDVEDAQLEDCRIIARRTRDANADIFRILRTKVLQSMAQSNLRAIAVTSPNYGDGKTTVAINLALSLALDVKQTILLVDLDLRKPNIHSFLGIEADVGLGDYFLRNTPIPDCLVKPSIDRLVVLPMCHPLDNSSELLGTPKMAALARELKTRYADRIVIYDMPPILTQDDTIAFLPHVDGVILVLRDGVTQIDEVNHCINVLGNANVLGTVLNDCTEPGFNRV